MSGIAPPSGPGVRRSQEDRPAEPRPAGTTDRAAATAADADRLKALLEDAADEDAGAGGGGSDEQSAPKDMEMSPADAILMGLGAIAAPAAREAPPAADAVVPVRGAELSELADKIAERVLVGTRTDGEAELRITLNSETFGATEVSLARHHGTLELRIDTMSFETRKLLQANAAEFTTALSTRLGMTVALEVNAAGEADPTFQQGGDDNRRSRGYEQILRYVAGNET